MTPAANESKSFPLDVSLELQVLPWSSSGREHPELSQPWVWAESKDGTRDQFLLPLSGWIQPGLVGHTWTFFPVWEPINSFILRIFLTTLEGGGL